jgi:hypothetical protein
MVEYVDRCYNENVLFLLTEETYQGIKNNLVIFISFQMWHVMLQREKK